VGRAAPPSPIRLLRSRFRVRVAFGLLRMTEKDGPSGKGRSVWKKEGQSGKGGSVRKRTGEGC